ncbi:MAG TPA: 23S rRNA (adenine(2503)-C(2))-methyltransferase RlmN [Rhabdochlamydiaceae bacterium]|nr:23S rRNA (adenine(2503)-C(2))-methyltransferase RlmN [Rhabdochlamydiaceae bacterium]
MSSSIFQYTQKNFSETCAALFGKGKLHAKHLYTHWMRKGTLSGLNVEKQAASLLEKIIGAFDFSLPELSSHWEEEGVVKFLLKMEGMLSESVIIPMKTGTTLCVSSQIGCAMGCAFCETGKMGLRKQLSAEEIIAQMFYAVHHFGANVRNIVFMGMGEPMDNWDNVKKAIHVLTDPHGFGLGPSRITVSTSGHVEGIYRLMEEMDPALNLAVSLNAPEDAIRRRIMPVNKRWNMTQLKEAMVAYCTHPRRKILIEYVLLRGINDSIEQASQVADYLQGLKVKVNLIPYNPQRRGPFAPPSQEILEQFRDYLKGRGYQVLLRQTKGQKIRAACGQLGNTPSQIQA